MLAAVTELSFVARLGFAVLQTPPPESKWLPDFVYRITATEWIIIAIVAVVPFGIILYFFAIDEIELGFPPKLKFKRRVRLAKEQAATPVDSVAPHLTTQGAADQATPLLVPATIEPNLVHPYPLQANFTGRVKEREELTAWLSDNEHPIYELVAMGGMGKSALTWVWLTRDITPSSEAKLEGVMWWSFYEGESSFAKFVDDALKYVSGQPIDSEQFPTTYDRAQELRKQLQTKRVLFVLDGFERQLRAYAGLDAAYKSHDHTEPSAEARSCVDPITSRLLRDIAAVTTRAKVLLTSRLTVSDLEDRAGDPLAGVVERELKELSRDDAIAFMRAQGVRKGTDAEIANACAGYGYHALSLRLLSGLIEHDAKMPGDINAAPRHDVHDDLVQRQHHVLAQSYEALPKRERALLSRIAAFRGPMTYDAVVIFNTLGNEARFETALDDLRVRGLLQRDTAHNRYDLHPIVRHYCYDRLTDKMGIHTRLRDYFATIPVPDKEKVQSLEDLVPVIELYHHTARAGRYDEAFELFAGRLEAPLYFRFGAYQTCMELLRALFPDGEDRPPRLKKDHNQGWVLGALANAYYFCGQPRNAVPLFSGYISISEKRGDQSEEAIGVGNISSQQIILGELLAAERSLRRRITLSHEIKDDFLEAVGHQELARLFTFLGAFDEAEREFENGINLLENTLAGQWWQGTSWLYRAQSGLLRHHIPQAINSAREAKRLKDIEYPGIGKVERDIIQAEWLLGAALVMEGKDMNGAATHLTEALTRCRRINLVEFEPDILLAWARWHRAKGNDKEALAQAEEALAIADRCEYRLKQAEIHNFLARLAMDAGNRDEARKEAEIAKERAWCDGPPHCYKPALDEAEAMLRELGA